MGWFDKRNRTATSTPPKPVSEWVANPAVVSWELGDPATLAYSAALASGEWTALRDAVGDLPPAGTAEVLCAADPEPVPVDVADRWLAAAPDDPMAIMVRGDLGVRHAWAARSARMPEHVSADAFATFFDRLRSAETLLHRAVRECPDATAPRAALVISGRGLQIPLEEISGRFDAAQECSPWEPNAVQAMLQSVCDKWFGSHDMMFTFARMVTDDAPPGSPSHSAIPIAHAERSIADKYGDATWLERADVRDEIVEAAERSVLHPAFVPTPSGLKAANAFAATLWMGGHVEPALRAFAACQGRYCVHPWRYFLLDFAPHLRRIELQGADAWQSIAPKT